MQAAADAALLMCAAGYVAVVVVLVVGLCRAVREDRDHVEPAAPVPDALDVELEALLVEADREAVLNATRCDCAGCRARREARS